MVVTVTVAVALLPDGSVVVYSYYWRRCFDDKQRRSTTRWPDVRTLQGSAGRARTGSSWLRQGVCAAVGPIRPWPGLIARLSLTRAPQRSLLPSPQRGFFWLLPARAHVSVSVFFDRYITLHPVAGLDSGTWD